MDPKKLLSSGIRAAREGNHKSARDLIARAVKADPELLQGWWALAHLLEEEKQQIYCLNQVLRIDPQHQKAAAELNALLRKEESEPRRSESASVVQRPKTSPAREVPVSPASEPEIKEEIRAPEEQPRSSKGVWIAVIATISLILVGVALTFLVIAGVIRNPFSRTQTDLSAVVPPTMPPVWTTTPTATPPSMTETAQVAQQGSPAPVEQQEFSNEVEAALELMHEDQLERALDAWNEILDEDPDDHFSLAMRAHTRLRLLRGETSLARYVDESLQAIADADQAIALQPNQNGDYYIARAYGFENLSLVPGVRVDQD
ncbi:MAG: hypothetical protein PVG04_07700, partial [Anaerolineales bacterium]